MTKSQCCSFQLRLFLHRGDDLWYLSEAGLNDLIHLKHIYVDPRHMVAPSNLLSNNVSLFIENLVENNVDAQG